MGRAGRTGQRLLLRIGVLLLAIAVLGWAVARSASGPGESAAEDVSASALPLPIGGDAEIERPDLLQLTGTSAGTAAGEPDGSPPVEIVVDPKGGGDTQTIADALAGAPAGAIIRLRHGIYKFGIELDKTVHLLGDSEQPEMVSVIVSDQPCLTSHAANASIRGISLRNEGAGRKPCVAVIAGRLQLDNVTIASGSGSALAISGNADVTGHGLIIRDSGEAGVSVRDGGRLVLDDSSVETSRSAGISLVNSGEVTLSNDRIVGSAGTGIVVADNSKARLIDNFVAGNAWSGIEVLRSSSAEVIGNVISGNREAGIYLSRDGGGQFSRNRVTESGLSGIVVDDSTGTFDDNQVQKNAENGVYVSRGGKASFIDNHITGNNGHGLAVEHGSLARVKNNEVSGNGRRPQVMGPVEHIR